MRVFPVRPSVCRFVRLFRGAPNTKTKPERTFSTALVAGVTIFSCQKIKGKGWV